VEPGIRFRKQRLNWTKPQLQSKEVADRWSELVGLYYIDWQPISCTENARETVWVAQGQGENAEKAASGRQKEALCAQNRLTTRLLR